MHSIAGSDVSYAVLSNGDGVIQWTTISSFKHFDCMNSICLLSHRVIAFGQMAFEGVKAHFGKPNTKCIVKPVYLAALVFCDLLLHYALGRTSIEIIVSLRGAYQLKIPKSSSSAPTNFFFVVPKSCWKGYSPDNQTAVLSILRTEFPLLCRVH